MTKSSLKRNIYKLIIKAMSLVYYKSIILLGIFVLTMSCSKSEINIPNCIDTKISTLKNAPVQNPPAEIWKWVDNETTYYYITSDCCDQYNYLYNENCEIVCAPDGGFTGNGDGDCPTLSNTIIKTLIWKDDRN
jgi:hypothetical protein